MDRNDRIKGCMIGGTVGAAFGYRLSHGNTTEDMAPATRLDLRTMKGIAASRGITEKTSYGYGHAISGNILSEYGKSNEADSHTPEDAVFAGIAPIALFCSNHFVDAIQIAILGGEVAKYIHNRPRYTICAAIYSFVISKLLEEINGIGRDTYLKILDSSREILPYLLDYEHGKTFTDLYREEMAAAVRTLDKARKLAFDKMDDSAAFEDIGPGNSPDEILTVAFYSSAKYYGDFEASVKCAANVRGDKSSACAAAGNLTGLLHGSGCIPQEMLAGFGYADTVMDSISGLIHIKTDY